MAASCCEGGTPVIRVKGSGHEVFSCKATLMTRDEFLRSKVAESLSNRATCTNCERTVGLLL
jgi:hypothetical protein